MAMEDDMVDCFGKGQDPFTKMCSHLNIMKVKR